MYTGKYVATITIDLLADDELIQEMMPFDELKDAVENGELTEAIRAEIQNEVVCDFGKVTVEQIEANLVDESIAVQ